MCCEVAKFPHKMKGPTRRPFERRAACIKEPSISDWIQLFCLSLLLFFPLMLCLVDATPPQPVVPLCPCVVSSGGQTDVYWGFMAVMLAQSSTTSSCATCDNRRIKPVTVCVFLLMCRWISSWLEVLLCWNHKATSLTFIHVKMALSILILFVLQLSVMAASSAMWDCKKKRCQERRWELLMACLLDTCDSDAVIQIKWWSRLKS